MDVANQQLTSAQEDLNSASAAVTSTKATLDNATASLNNVGGDTDTNNITTNAAYMNVLQKYANEIKNGTPEYNITISNADSGTLAEQGEHLAAINTYQHNVNDENTMVTISNGTVDHDTAVKLTQFTTGLINPIRKQLGLPGLQINESSIKIAMDVAKRYTDDNWNFIEQGGHDIAGLNAIGQKYSNGLAENIGSTLLENKSTFNLDQLKAALYNSIIGMLFEDASSNWGHTTNFLLFNGLDGGFVGVSFDGLNQDHFDFEWDSHGTTSYTLQGNVWMEGTNANTLFNQYYHQSYQANKSVDQNTQNLQDTVKQATIDYNNAIKQQEQAQQVYDDAQQNQENKEDAYNNAISSKEQADAAVSAAQLALKQAQNQPSELTDAETYGNQIIIGGTTIYFF